jgi:small subunit ribosomal protein S20
MITLRLHSNSELEGSPLATHKSAEKRARQSVKRNARNTAAEGAVRTLERKVRTALAGNDKAAATALMKEYMSKMSKAGTKGVVHAKTAARKIGRLASRVHQLGASK